MRDELHRGGRGRVGVEGCGIWEQRASSRRKGNGKSKANRKEEQGRAHLYQRRARVRVDFSSSIERGG